VSTTDLMSIVAAVDLPVSARIVYGCQLIFYCVTLLQLNGKGHSSRQDFMHGDQGTTAKLVEASRPVAVNILTSQLPG
jgi:hypothetical protein